MIKDFNKDKEAAKYAEQLVLNTLSSLATGCKFTDVSNIKKYRYKGDILVTAADGQQYFLEVKDDSRIADTHNILCEYENYIKDEGRFIKGNMQSDYDFYCVVSQQQRKIFIYDFSILKQIYTKGTHKIIYHQDQDTYCYLLPQYIADRYNAHIKTIDY